MKKLVIVEGDEVSNIGKDKHEVYGTDKSYPPEPISKSFSYDFSGKVKEKSNGNDFVAISGKKIITKGNNECPQTQAHIAGDVTAAEKSKFGEWATKNSLGGFGFAPAIVNEPDNNGENSSDAGSSFVTISGAPVILNADNFDTCHSDGTTNKGRSTTSKVTATVQDFVTVSE